LRMQADGRAVYCLFSLSFAGFAWVRPFGLPVGCGKARIDAKGV
jgi:hypothetical protein